MLLDLDVLLINDGEAQMLAERCQPGAGGEEDPGDGPEDAGREARRVRRDGLLQRAVISGAKPETCATPFRAPALPLAEVVDPTGAGDSFAGGFFGYLASQKAS